MIDVPVRVKDACREGNLLKNYKFIVYNNYKLEAELQGSPYKFNVNYSTTYYFTMYSDDYDPYDPWKYAVYDANGVEIDGGLVIPPPLGAEYLTLKVDLTAGTSIVLYDCPEMKVIITSIGWYDPEPILTIENDNLVKESVKIDERLCSGDTIQFGVCEGSSLEFQYFGIQNITGCRVQASVQVQYKDTDHVKKWHTIPMGWFTVKESSRQASTGIMKVTAYNKLKSDYLDASVNAEVMALVQQGEDGQSSVSLYKLLETLLDGFSIERYNKIDAEITATYNYSVQANSLVLCNSSGQSRNLYLNVKFGHATFYIDPASPDYYEYCIYTYKEALKTATLSLIESVYNTQAYGTSYINAYPNGQSHSTETMTLEDAVKGLYDLQYYVAYSHNQNPMFGLAGGTDDYILTFDGDYDTKTHLPARVMCQFTIPYSMTISQTRETTANVSDFTDYLTSLGGMGDLIHVYKLDVPEMAKIQINITTAERLTSQNITLRDIQSSIYESNCEFGKLDRETDLFSGVSLTNERLYPHETLYPDNSLYPQGDSERGNFSMYGKLWADEGNIRKFRNLIINYKGTETIQGSVTEVDKTYTKLVNADGTDDYYCTNNWLFKNMVWTDEAIEDYADAMADKMENISWFPFEMWCAGLPYIETGDEIEINLDEQAYTSYVLRRSLNGIQNLQDDFINGTLDIF